MLQIANHHPKSVPANNFQTSRRGFVQKWYADCTIKHLSTARRTSSWRLKKVTLITLW